MKKNLILGLERLSKEQMKQIEGGCAVSCQSGFYACCNTDTCKCIKDTEGFGNTCASGGSGYSTCSS